MKWLFDCWRWLKVRLWLPVLAMDVLILPGIPACKWLLGRMLDEGKPCNWTRVGARCATCGGTHCVQSFLQGAFVESFVHNPMVFCWILYAIGTGLLLNFGFLFRQKWAVTVLKKMYSMTAFYVALGVYLLYSLLRNLPLLLTWIF